MRAQLTKHPRGLRARIVALYADIRDFSTGCNTARASEIAKLVEICYERVHQLHVDYHHNFHRLLGDGFLLVWEINEFSHYDANTCDGAAGALSEAIGAAFEIHKKYFYLRKSLPFSTPMGFGISITLGEGYRVRLRTALSKLDEDDYVGYPMNLGARLQRLAEPNEVILDPSAAEVCRTCPRELLRTDSAGFELEILRPAQSKLKMAVNMKGLRRRDSSGFRYLRQASPFYSN